MLFKYIIIIMSSTTCDVTPSSETELLTGRVKWFNNKAGYGFITVTNGSRSGTDVFIHHSAINVEQQQYKYLVQGEYVEFNLVRTDSSAHEWQSTNVNGIQGGKLMCETRNENKLTRTTYNKSKTDVTTEVLNDIMPKQTLVQTEPRSVKPRVTKTRVRGEGPRDENIKHVVKEKPVRGKRQTVATQTVVTQSA